MPEPSLPPRVAFTSSVAPVRVSSGRKRIRNSSLPGSRMAYSVYASCVNSLVNGAVGRSEPSGFVPPGNGLLAPPRCACRAAAPDAAHAKASSVAIDRLRMGEVYPERRRSGRPAREGVRLRSQQAHILWACPLQSPWIPCSRPSDARRSCGCAASCRRPARMSSSSSNTSTRRVRTKTAWRWR